MQFGYLHFKREAEYLEWMQKNIQKSLVECENALERENSVG